MYISIIINFVSYISRRFRLYDLHMGGESFAAQLSWHWVWKWPCFVRVLGSHGSTLLFRVLPHALAKSVILIAFARRQKTSQWNCTRRETVIIDLSLEEKIPCCCFYQKGKLSWYFFTRRQRLNKSNRFYVGNSFFTQNAVLDITFWNRPVSKVHTSVDVCWMRQHRPKNGIV